MRKFVILLMLPVFLFGIDNINHDFQLWTLVAFDKKLNDKFTFEILGSNRRDKNATRSYYNYVQFNIIWSPCKSWKIAPGFRQAYVKVAPSNWKADPIPMIDITKTWSLWKLKIADRNRIEYKCRDEASIYRNRLGIQTEKRYTCLKVSPYISDEIFLTRFNRLTQNRLQVGLAAESGFDVAYMYRSKESGTTWIQQNVLALSYNKEF